MGTFATPDRHHEVIPRTVDPRFETPPTRLICHSDRRKTHEHLRAHCMIAIVRRKYLSRHRESTIAVTVGRLQIGGGAPVAVQSMTDTDTADASATAEQCVRLAAAGAEMVRISIDRPEAAAAVPAIRKRLNDQGCSVPLAGDFHYNGHILLRKDPVCARTLDKFRINPGTVGAAATRDANFDEICTIARDHDKALRIGVNSGSLDPRLVTAAMAENASARNRRASAEIIDDCMVSSALQWTTEALETGLGEERIVVSCKASDPSRLIAVNRKLARHTRQPIHLGLTEAGMGTRGVVWSAAAMAVLLEEGIGDTIRVSLTPRPGEQRTNEVSTAREILQSLGLRAFAPTITACPGCGRTESGLFQDLAERVGAHIDANMPVWKRRHPGVEELTLAVMGCVVNGPGESREADIGISLPGTGEEPRCPVYVDSTLHGVLEGRPDEIAVQFVTIIENYVAEKWPETKK